MIQRCCFINQEETAHKGFNFVVKKVNEEDDDKLISRFWDYC